MVGVWPALRGSVRLDGSDISHWNSEELGRYVGYLPQDVELFAGTVAQNIARFREIDTESVIFAAELAGCHSLIQGLTQGYNTQIGEGGQALSGGQRQRIGLARALYDNPSLIVLDEPNANLDAAGEEALLAAIQKLKAKHVTVAIITHKINVLAGVDNILLMADGTVQAFGTREVILPRLVGPRAIPSVPQQRPGRLPKSLRNATDHHEEKAIQPITFRMASARVRGIYANRDDFRRRWRVGGGRQARQGGHCQWICRDRDKP